MKKAESAPLPMPMILASSTLELGKIATMKIVNQIKLQKIAPARESSLPRNLKKTLDMAKAPKTRTMRFRKVIFIKVF